MVPSTCLVPSLASFPFAAAYIVQSVASAAKIPLLMLGTVNGAPLGAKSKKGPIAKLVSSHPRKAGLGVFLIIRFSLSDPQTIPGRTSLVVGTSIHFSLPVAMAFSRGTLKG